MSLAGARDEDIVGGHAMKPPNIETVVSSDGLLATMATFYILIDGFIKREILKQTIDVQQRGQEEKGERSLIRILE